HAVEARIYAEDPARGFLPATGTLHHLRFPDARSGLRVDSGVREGDAIGTHYDPLIAKVIAHGEDRPAALAAMGAALEETEIAGVSVNTAFLARLARDPEFAAGRLDTGLIDRRQEALTAVPEPAARSVAAAALAASGARFRPEAADPFDAIAAYAHFHPLTRRLVLHHGERAITAAITGLAEGRYAVSSEGQDGGTVTLSPEAVGRIAAWPGHVTVFEGADSHTFRLHDPLASGGETAAGDSLLAPMPGL